MKFKLEPYNRNISKQQVVDDIRRVATKLGKDSNGTLTIQEYEKHGSFDPGVARRACGSWFDAISEAGLCPSRLLSVSAEDCIADLGNVARKLGKSSVTQREYSAHGKYSPKPLLRHFGSWFAAIAAAGLERTRTLHVTEQDYFENLEAVWVRLGRQPTYSEMRKPFSKYSVGAYVCRFGSWRGALESFVAFVNDESETRAGGRQYIEPSEEEPEQSKDQQRIPGRTSRSISWRLRFLVMRRDDFRCTVCGRSPAMNRGVTLHVDHIHPWSKSGTTTLENLQTLCEECNIGKSDLPMKEGPEQDCFK
ncbi:MAG: HNH endonuclease [Planctomycetia bacterium]|nr:HNH endonuclease [Planctomycetia bacterium]